MIRLFHKVSKGLLSLVLKLLSTYSAYFFAVAATWWMRCKGCITADEMSKVLTVSVLEVFMLKYAHGWNAPACLSYCQVTIGPYRI